MKRRGFLAGGAGGALASAMGGSASAAVSASPAPAVLAAYTREDHRRRLENVGFCTRSIRACLRKHLVRDYIPGHCRYDLNRETQEPTEEDDRNLARLSESGIGLIQPWSGWATCWRGTRIVARNQAGFRRFIDLAHKHRLKVLPYTSSFYYERTAPELNPEFAWPASFDLRGRLAHGSPASPGWRAFTFPRLIGVMDDYGVDGLYDDLGYLRPGERPNYYGPSARRFTKDDVAAFDEGPFEDGAMGDWIAMLYAEVKRRGGIFKLHKEGTDLVHTPMKSYDYLWVGEETRDIDWLREKTKNYEPYLIPQPLLRLGPEAEVEGFLHSIPYLQFPILGRGEGGQFRDDYPAAHARWLKLYRPLVEDGSWAWIEVSDSTLFPEPPPRGVVASVFANREVYLVLANYRKSRVEIATEDAWDPVEPAGGAAARSWQLEGRSLRILRRAAQA